MPSPSSLSLWEFWMQTQPGRPYNASGWIENLKGDLVSQFSFQLQMDKDMLSASWSTQLVFSASPPCLVPLVSFIFSFDRFSTRATTTLLIGFGCLDNALVVRSIFGLNDLYVGELFLFSLAGKL